MDFEWDPAKAAINQRRHGVSFPEAATVFADPFSVTDTDPGHSDDEDRFSIGTSNRGTLMMVGHTVRGSRLRLISARILTHAERTQYEEGL